VGSNRVRQGNRNINDSPPPRLLELSTHGHGRMLLAGTVRQSGAYFIPGNFSMRFVYPGNGRPKATGIKPDGRRTSQDLAIIGNRCFVASLRPRPQDVPFAGLHLLIRIPAISPAWCRLIYFKQLATSYINALCFCSGPSCYPFSSLSLYRFWPSCFVQFVQI